MNLVKGSILIVDDYENWRILAKTILEDDGHSVTAVSTQAEATEELHTADFDVVILDMRLVDAQKFNVEGLALLRLIKSQTPSTGAIILTGYPTETVRIRALTVYGADAYIDKVPSGGDFDILGFLHLVNSLIQRKYGS